MRPRKVSVGAHVFQIHWDEASWDRLRIREDGLGNLIGRTSFEHHEIYVKPGMKLDQQQDTLLHEIMHCIFGVGIGNNLQHVHDALADSFEEFMCSSFTPWWLLVLQANPTVTAFLLSTSEG